MTTTIVSELATIKLEGTESHPASLTKYEEYDLRIAVIDYGLSAAVKTPDGNEILLYDTYDTRRVTGPEIKAPMVQEITFVPSYGKER